MNLFDYAQAGGTPDVMQEAMDVRTRHALNSILLWPLIMSDVSTTRMGVEVVGQQISIPVIGGTSPAFDSAERNVRVAAVEAMNDANTVQIASCRWDPETDQLASAGSRIWLSIPLSSDGGATAKHVERAETNGYRALVVDADINPGGAGPRASWDTVRLLRSQTDLPIVVSGILRASDAITAVESGVNGIVVSCVPRVASLIAPIDALREVSAAVAGSCSVLYSGGIRRGVDVVRIASLGASAGIVTRPLLGALRIGGRDEVKRLLATLQDELLYAMETCGIRSLSEAATGNLVRPGSTFTPGRSVAHA
jgi:isopentenyl diphosphate isomerase/L-lactate dehydrogenase-like FMN-dependent dehydrogenase